jgi:hypothetical protein
MADDKKGPNRAGNSGGAGRGQAGKKPTPMLDLKATEVRGSVPAKEPKTSDRAKFATGSTASTANTASNSATSNLKGAPDYKTGSGSDRAAATGRSSIPSTGSGRADANANQAQAAAGQSGAGRGTQQTSSAGAKSGQGSGGGSGDQRRTAQASGTGASQTPPPAARKSGGGFFSTLSHLVAGVVGGGIALFAAEPLSQQFNLPLGKSNEVPVQLEQRIAALETRPQGGVSGVKPEEVSKLSQAIEAAQGRINELGKLNDEVAALSKEVDAIKARPQAGGGTASGSAGGAGEADTGPLRARLDKLENALTTLSSATNADGGQNPVAPMAQFSSKIADLESSLNTQISELRSGLLKEIDTKVAATAETGSQAAAATQRLDREFAAVKTDTARLDQRAETLKVATDKLGETLRAVKEQAATIKVELDGLKGDVEQQFTKVARPADVDKAIAPVTDKIASIEKDLGSVVANEDARKANAERIVLSLQLANLKRVLDRGQPYAGELEDVKKVAGGAIDFSSLESHAGEGVANTRELTRQFQNVAYRIINADSAKKGASVVDRLLAGAKSIVQVRRTDEAAAKSDGSEAAVARIEQQLKQGNLPKALAEVQKLPDAGKAVAKGWISELEARASVDKAIAEVEDQLKASLGAGKAPGKEG